MERVPAKDGARQFDRVGVEMADKRMSRRDARRQERAARGRRRAVLYGSGLLALVLVIG